MRFPALWLLRWSRALPGSHLGLRSHALRSGFCLSFRDITRGRAFLPDGKSLRLFISARRRGSQNSWGLRRPLRCNSQLHFWQSYESQYNFWTLSASLYGSPLPLRKQTPCSTRLEHVRYLWLRQPP